jgi:hypothetical protein
MIHFAPLLGGPVRAVGRRCTLIVGLGFVLGPGGSDLAPGRPLHGFGCRHCLVNAAPIGSRGYATGVEFAAHLSRADGSSQVLVTVRWLFRRSGCCSGVSRRCLVLLPALCVPAPNHCSYAVPRSLAAPCCLDLLVTVEGGCGRLELPRELSRVSAVPIVSVWL